MTVPRRSVAPLVGWTLFLWVSRIRNVVQNDELDTMGTVWRIGAAGIFLALGVAALSAMLWGRPGPRVYVALGVWTAGYWLVRGTAILVDPNHDLGFKLVHAALMVVSLAVVAVAYRGSRAASRVPVG